MNSKVLKKIKFMITNPRDVFFHILGYRFFRILPDKLFLQLKYYVSSKRKLDLVHPVTFTEKLQWLKLYDRKPLYVKLADKYSVREYIKNRIGEEYLVPLLGVYQSFEEIDFDLLPDRFVLKPNHTSGDIYICTDKSKLDKIKLKKLVNKWLRRNYYWIHREWPYKYVKPKIVCEQFMSDSDAVPDDIKVLCFHGKAKLIEVHTGRFGKEHMITTFTPDWKRSTLMHDFPPFLEHYDKPVLLDKMIELSEQVAKDLIHVRVDWYAVDNKLYIGELTFFVGAGFLHYDNDVDDYIVGQWMKLPQRRR